MSARKWMSYTERVRVEELLRGYDLRDLLREIASDIAAALPFGGGSNA